jgi:hypothetical protein
MATNWNTIHIFGFGDVQVIAKDNGATKKAYSLTKLQLVINDIASFKPSTEDLVVENTKKPNIFNRIKNTINSTFTKKVDEVIVVDEYHAINIHEGMFASFIPKSKDGVSYRVEYSKLNQANLQDLVFEILQKSDMPTT